MWRGSEENTMMLGEWISHSRNGGIPGGSDGKESACNAGDLGSNPRSGKSPGEGNSYPFQYSGVDNSTDRGAWWVTVHGVAKSGTQLSNQHTHT